MTHLLMRRLRDKFWPEPLPDRGTFDGSTILVTGATTGLGRAAVQHFATLGAKVIMTSRSIAQGEATRRQIEESASIGRGQIEVLHLDMNRYSQCLDFVQVLKRSELGKSGINCAVLNAGIINAEYVVSPEGWEQTIQINTLSTTLLGLLLIQWMKATHSVGEPKPHLVVVASRDHLDPDISSWEDWSKNGGILKHLSRKENWLAHQADPNYANSKLLLMYAVNDLCEKAKAQDGSVQVIVNSLCPGLVSTDITRSIVQRSTMMKVGAEVYLGSLGKSADYGARFYVTAALSSEEHHGRNMQSLFREEEYQRLAVANLTSGTARRVCEIVQKEVSKELKESLERFAKLST